MASNSAKPIRGVPSHAARPSVSYSYGTSTKDTQHAPPTLSIVIPVFNERDTLPSILESVLLALPSVNKQIVIVDDCSTDGSREWLQQYFSSSESQMLAIGHDSEGHPTFVTSSNRLDPFKAQHFDLELPEVETTVTSLFHAKNLGKGAALRTGFAKVRGEIVVIQDADLEYDPADLKPMLQLITENVADVVYGCRFYGNPHRCFYYHHYLGNKLICLFFNLLYNQLLGDIEVCYKMFRREVLDSVYLSCDDFGFEVEFSAAVVKCRRWRIFEIGISYYGRTFEEGKKINWRDGVRALWYVFKYRF